VARIAGVGRRFALEPALLYEEAILRGGTDSASLKKMRQKNT
jgi:hypothetical protein